MAPATAVAHRSTTPMIAPMTRGERASLVGAVIGFAAGVVIAHELGAQGAWPVVGGGLCVAIPGAVLGGLLFGG
ncbi:MAG: hypothetical protein ACREL5_14655 [Gemmatimonadales bacterium]